MHSCVLNLVSGPFYFKTVITIPTISWKRHFTWPESDMSLLHPLGKDFVSEAEHLGALCRLFDLFLLDGGHDRNLLAHGLVVDRRLGPRPVSLSFGLQLLRFLGSGRISFFGSAASDLGIQGLFLDTHALTMSREVVDIHRERVAMTSYIENEPI